MSATENPDQLWEVAPTSEAVGMPMADWWRRAAALVVDVAVLWIPLALATRDIGHSITAYGIWVAVGVTYFAFLNGGRRGQTLGKMVWEIRVRDAATGGPLGVPKAALRYLAPTLPTLIPILGLLLWVTDGVSALWDDRRQTVHDKLAGSVVVKAR